MNCANHPDRERTAFCQNCGKPLCDACVRKSGSSIFCEPCFAVRTSVPPAAGYGYPHGYPPAPPMGPPPAPGVPNPGLAALLGFIPGVGAMYNEQYAKGIVHLIVFAVLVSLTDNASGLFLLFVFGWEFYMVIEAHHTARARRDGTPLPNPFGLNDLAERLGFGRAWPGSMPGAAPFAGPDQAGAPGHDAGANVPPANPYTPPVANPYAPPPPPSYSYVPAAASWATPPEAQPYGVPPIPPEVNARYYRRFPAGAIWLIGLGLLFLAGNIPMFHLLHGRLFVPVLLIALAVWIFVSRMTASGQGLGNDGSDDYRWRLSRALSGSFWLMLVGVIWLLDALRILTWSLSWPLFLIAGGLMMFFRRAWSPGYGYGPMHYPGAGMPPPAGTAGAAPEPQPQAQQHSSDEEGR